jgi:hypothetical protein
MMKVCTYCSKEHPEEATVCSIDGHALRSTIPASPTQATGQTESIFGIVSFGISVWVGVPMLVTFLAAGILNSGRLQRGGRYPGQELVGLAVLFLLAADLAAIEFGIAAFCQPGKKKLLGTLGLVFSSGTVISSVALVIIGLVYASKFRH